MEVSRTIDAIEQELEGERATALGDSGRKLEAALAELALGVSELAAIEKSILETSAQMTQAGEARDIDRLFGFMLETDKGSVTQNGRILLTRAEALEQTKKNMSGISRIGYKWKQQHVTVVSPTVALLIAEGESSVTTEQGQSFAVPFAQTIVFVLTTGAGRCFTLTSPPLADE